MVRPAPAHRLDEYLQAALVAIAADHVEVQLRLTPGVAVLPAVLALIDTDGDGLLSSAEQRAYTARVLSDLTLTLDGQPLSPRITAARFPGSQALRQGLGEIAIDLNAPLPAFPLPRFFSSHHLTFENRHLRALGAFQVNCLAPEDPAIKISAQRRDYAQTRYDVEYEQAQVFSVWPSSVGGLSLWLALLGFLLLGRLAYIWPSLTLPKESNPTARS
jgi:hypothetical protein